MRPDEPDELGLLIRREATRHAAPPALAGRIREQLRGAAGTRPAPPKTRVRWLPSLAIFGAGAAASWALSFALLMSPVAGTVGAIGDVVADSHVRSLLADHLTDVASSDHHTVKPWFAGKLDFSPPVVDLSDEGQPLVGARLDYLDGHPVAALVYRSGPHIVNLFVWPARGAADTAPRLLSRRGYNLVQWTEGGMQAWAVSDLNAVELEAFAGRVRERVASAAPTIR